MTDWPDDRMREPRRKRLLYRALHRGTKEADIAIGGFAQSRLPRMTEAQLNEFERLLDVPDQDLLGWIIGSVEIPPDFRGEVIDMMRVYPIARSLATRLEAGMN